MIYFALTGCVEVTDLRTEVAEDVLVGQIDTGWSDVSNQISCTDKSDCPQGECGTSICREGRCIISPIKDGQPCSDGNPKSVGDLCIEGICVPGTDVCICENDNDCLIYGNGNQCDGRLMCDGCACIPIDTPVGTPCDDGNPLTTNDICNDDRSCTGEQLCQCAGPNDCKPVPCTEMTCDGCLCKQHPAELGHIYVEHSFAEGIPETWSSTSTSENVIWRPANGGLRVGNSSGLYSGSATIAELKSEEVFIPLTTVVLEIDIALFSAESGCGDKLDVYINETLADTLCGPTPLTRRRYHAMADEQGKTSVRLVFESNDDENDAAGPFIGPVRWIRAQWDTCGLLPSERVAPSSQNVAEYSPAVGAYGTTVDIYWGSPTGIVHRLFTSASLGAGQDTLLDPLGEQPTAAGEYALWARPEQNTLAVYHSIDETIDIITANNSLEGYDLDVSDTGPALTWRTVGSDATAPHTVFVRIGSSSPSIIGPSLMPHAPRITITSDGPRVLVSGELTLAVHSLNGMPPVEVNKTSTFQPTIASGHDGYAIIATTSDGIWVGTGMKEATLAANSIVAADIAAYSGGWYILWASRSSNETNVFMATTTPEMTEISAVNPPISEYTYANQDSPILSVGASDVWAAWRTDWYGGDTSTVVFRSVQDAL